MQAKNKYAYRAKISESTLKQLVKLFMSGANATLISERLELNRNSVNKYLMELREVMAHSCEAEAPSTGELDFDAYFLDLRQDVAKGAEARVDKSFAVIWSPDCRRVHSKMVSMDKNASLWERLTDMVRASQQNQDQNAGVKWRCYEDFGYRKYFRVAQPDSNGKTWPAGEKIEAFWGGAKERVIALRGVPCHTFYLHLKECQFRFNHQTEDLARLMLGMLQKEPLGRKEAARRPLTSPRALQDAAQRPEGVCSDLEQNPVL